MPGEWEAEYECKLKWGSIDGWEWECDVEYVWEEGGIVTVYPGQNNAAVSVWKKAVLADSVQALWRDVGDFVALQLAVNVQVGPWCIVVHGDDDEGTCLREALAAIIVGLANLLEDDIAPINREPDIVYLTGHRTVIGPYHTAVGYRNPITNNRTTVSAAPEEIFAIGVNTKLVAAENRKPDLYNITLSTIASSILAEPASLHFQSIRDASGNYEVFNCLPYQGVPLSDGYNSNSYTTGLVIATCGIPNPITTYVGSNRPVPSAWFSNSPPPCP